MLLRPLRIDDWEAVHDWARMPEACRYQAWGPDTPAQTRAFVTAAVSAFGNGRFTYAAVVDGVVRGLGELKLHHHREGEISYIVHPLHWGNGLGTAIGLRLLELAFTEHKLHRVFGTCDPRNAASGRVLRKLGMAYEGRMRETMLIRDGWRDSDLYSILEHEHPSPDPHG